MSHNPQENRVTRELFEDPIVQLAALCPFCALAALSPHAALAALSPVLQIFNPAVNPFAALLSFSRGNPQAQVANVVRARVGSRLTQLTEKYQVRQISRWSNR